LFIAPKKKVCYNSTNKEKGAFIMYTVTNTLIESFRDYLINEEKSPATIAKYIRDVQALVDWLSTPELDKPTVLTYKAHLMDTYVPTSVNAAISSLNSFFVFCEWYDLRVKNLKIQRQVFASQDTELTKKEYERLLKAAKVKHDRRLSLLMQTICSTGIRVSELRFITVESVSHCRADIRCKGKNRTGFCLPHCVSF
jgi:site-specific recombinase XerD